MHINHKNHQQQHLDNQHHYLETLQLVRHEAADRCSSHNDRIIGDHLSLSMDLFQMDLHQMELFQMELHQMELIQMELIQMELLQYISGLKELFSIYYGSQESSC